MLHDRDVVAPLRGQDAELVATEPRDEAALADRLDQPWAEVSQQDVAVVVPERVVDLLEAVEVHQHHDQPARDSARVADPLLHHLAETLTVGEAGQLVGGHDPLQVLAALLGLQQLADEVLEDHERQAKDG